MIDSLIPFSFPGKIKSKTIERFLPHGYTVDGVDYYDGLSNKWDFSLGYKREEIIDYVSQRMKSHPACKFEMMSPGVEELNHELDTITNGDFAASFYTLSGSDAVESAIRVAYHYHRNRKHVICYNGSYHGSTQFTSELTSISISNNRTIARTHIVHHIDPDELEEKILEIGPDDVACILKEPFSIQTSSVVLSPEYYKRVRELCDKHDILFIVDDVALCMGKTGEWFGYQRFEMEPDIVAFGKSVSAGYYALAGILVNDKVLQRLRGNLLSIGYTQSPHMPGIYSALKTIDTIRNEDLLNKVKSMEDQTPHGNAIGCYLSIEAQSTAASELRDQGIIASASKFNTPHTLRFMFQIDTDLSHHADVLHRVYSLPSVVL